MEVFPAAEYVVRHAADGAQRHVAWYEGYMRRGGMEGVYVDMREQVGLAKFAPVPPAGGPMFSARKRAGLGGKRRARCRKNSFVNKTGLPLWPHGADSGDAADWLGCCSNCT
jgi:hypothetical protein